MPNDTIILDGFKLAPGELEFKSDINDYYSDPPIVVKFDPYKSNDGSIKITYEFYK